MMARWMAGVLVPAAVLFGTMPAGAQTIRTLPLRASALAAEPVSGRLFAATPPTAGPGANSIVPIEPSTGVVGAAVYVGSDPRVLAATDDGQFLYVGLGGATALRRVDLAGLTAGPLTPLIRLGQFPDPEYAMQIVPVPGAPSTIVVNQATMSGYSRGLVAYENGVPRAEVIRDTVWSVVAIDASTFLATTSFAILQLRLDAGGLTLTGSRQLPVVPGRLLAAAGGLVYDEFDAAYDAATLELVRQPRAQSNGFVEQRRVVPAQGRTYLATAGTLVTRDLATADIRSTVPLPLDAGSPLSLVSLGGGVAYHTDLPQVVLVGDFTAAPPAPVPQPVTVNVELAACRNCRVGQAFAASTTFTNTSGAPQQAEVKAWFLSPGGEQYPTALGGPHTVIVVPPGTQTRALLAGVVPAGVRFGTWRVEVTLLEPVTGRVLGSGARLFTITF